MFAPLILIGYTTPYGSTRDVVEVIAETLRANGLRVDLQSLRDIRSLDRYSAVIVGVALYMYHWHKDALKFLSRHRKMLLELPVAVFVFGPTRVSHDDAEWQDSHDQLEKELAKYPWLKPAALKMFGGKFDPTLLRFPINKLAGSELLTDIRDWDAIRAWLETITWIRNEKD